MAADTGHGAFHERTARVMPTAKKANPVFYFVFTAVFWFSTYAYMPILSAYAQELKASDALIGAIGGAYGFTQMALRMPLGLWSDKLGKRKIFVFFALLAALLAALVVILFPSPATLLVCRMLGGVHASVWVPFTVLYASHFKPEQSVRAMSLLMTACCAGQLAANLLGGALAERAGYLAPFFLAMAGCALGALIATGIREPAQAANRPRVSLRVLFSGVIDRRIVVLTVVSIVFYYAEFGTVFAFTPLVAKELGASSFSLGMLSTVFTLFGMLGSMVSGKLSAFLGERRTLIGSILLTALCCGFLVPFMPNLASLYVLMAVSGFVIFVLSAACMGLVIRDVAPPYRASVMGFYQAVYGLGMFLGPVVTGMVSDFFGTTAAYISVGVLTAASAMLVFLLKEKKNL